MGATPTMATANPTGRRERDALHAEVRRLAAEEQLSNRAIARRTGVHHTTVGRILAAAPPAAPAVPVERTTTAPPAPTSGAARAPRLLHPLAPELIQDLNVLADPRTGALPAPLVRAIHAAAEHRRASMRTTARRLASEDAEPTGRAPARAQVAP